MVGVSGARSAVAPSSAARRVRRSALMGVSSGFPSTLPRALACVCIAWTNGGYMKNRLQTVCAGIAAASVLTTHSPVFAETVPAADNFVFWRVDEIPAGYRHMREIFSTDVVRR